MTADTMYAHDFVPYIDEKLIIKLIDGRTYNEIISGSKADVVYFLNFEDTDYILCDTECMYIRGNRCDLYVVAN
jgi:hypothetical protein